MFQFITILHTKIVKILGDERSLKVETIQENSKKEFTRPTDQFSLLEIDDDDVRNTLTQN